MPDANPRAVLFLRSREDERAPLPRRPDAHHPRPRGRARRRVAAVNCSATSRRRRSEGPDGATADLTLWEPAGRSIVPCSPGRFLPATASASASWCRAAASPSTRARRGDLSSPGTALRLPIRYARRDRIALRPRRPPRGSNLHDDDDDPAAPTAAPSTIAERVLDNLAAAVAEHRADRVVVDSRFNLDGTDGPTAEARATSSHSPSTDASRPVVLWDERLTTAQARRGPPLIRARGARRHRRRGRHDPAPVGTSTRLAAVARRL